MSKTKVLISEQDLIDMIKKAISRTGLDKLFSTKSDDDKNSLKDTSIPNTAGEFKLLNLKDPKDYNIYRKIADAFIQSRPHNLLGLTGDMFAVAAKRTFEKFGKYVPIELAMGQLAAEGGFSNNPNARPIKTKNPYNVGNVDTGQDVKHSSVQSGIQTYYDLIAKNYLTAGKTASDLLKNFVNKQNKRYASATEYEKMVRRIADQVKRLAEPYHKSKQK